MMLFLSHASADGALCEEIERHLSVLGVHTYLAEHDNQAGRLLVDKIREAIRRSDLVVVLLTRAAYQSDYVKQEVGVALEAGKLVIPMLDVTVERDPSRSDMLTGIEHISLDPAAPTSALAALSDRVASLAAQQTQRSAARKTADSATAEEWLLLAAAVVLIVASVYVGIQLAKSSTASLPT